jgi:ferredoxin-thioredoxin reductase catalytic subunit
MTDKKTILKQMQENARVNGYYLCPDPDLLNSLIDGLFTNQNRYGYGSCPCRMSSGIKNYDVDIICPCEYRDADVNEYGMCYCGLFVNEELKNDPSKMTSIPERRPIEVQNVAMNGLERKKTKTISKTYPPKSNKISSKLPVWRCTVCGYLCARELPPPMCPICKAKSERFEKFSLKSD